MFHNPELKVEIPPIPNAPAPAPACADAQVGRRPRIAIMGEFSAGKSTLTNLLIGTNALPVKVTATQLPPVWLSHGSGKPFGVDLDEASFEVDFNRIGDIPMDRAQYLRVERKASVLELCDIIDFPGISDPNMPAEVWQRVISKADAVLWCSHAVQAWRQSEAAVWDEMPPELQSRSLLLLTRMDKLSEERDRRRVLARVKRETEGMFADVLPISLTKALAAGEDRVAWEASGAEAFMSQLLDLVMTLSKLLGKEVSSISAMSDDAEYGWDDDEVSSRDAPVVATLPEPVSVPAAAERIVPRRVSLKGAPRRRPRLKADSDALNEMFRQG